MGVREQNTLVYIQDTGKVQLQEFVTYNTYLSII